MWHIAFTGEEPTDDQLPCPADAARPPGSPSDHRQWPGNRPEGYAASGWLTFDPVGRDWLAALGQRIARLRGKSTD